MRTHTLNLLLLAVAATALNSLPGLAQGSPNSIQTRGLQKATWYHAPIEIQILDGPGVRRSNNGYGQKGAYPAGSPEAAAPALPPVQSGGYAQTPVDARLSVPSAAGVASPPPLPSAHFMSNAPVRSPVVQQGLPGGTSTNLMGRLVKPQQPVTSAAPPRHQLISRPTASQARHLSNWPFAQDAPAVKPAPAAPRTVEAEPQTVKRYADYSSGAGAGGSNLRTTTSVSGRIKRGALLTGN